MLRIITVHMHNYVLGLARANPRVRVIPSDRKMAAEHLFAHFLALDVKVCVISGLSLLMNQC